MLVFKVSAKTVIFFFPSASAPVKVHARATIAVISRNQWAQSSSITWMRNISLAGFVSQQTHSGFGPPSDLREFQQQTKKKGFVGIKQQVPQTFLKSCLRLRFIFIYFFQKKVLLYFVLF